jgi:hypothetical protein
VQLTGDPSSVGKPLVGVHSDHADSARDVGSEIRDRRGGKVSGGDVDPAARLDSDPLGHRGVVNHNEDIHMRSRKR